MRPTTSFLTSHSYLRGMAANRTPPLPHSTAELGRRQWGTWELPALACQVEDQKGVLSRQTLETTSLN